MKRFYKTASIAEEQDGYSVRLDNRPVKTPAKNRLVLPTRQLAAAVADEWREQGEQIDAASMRLTRLANSAIDRVSAHRNAVIAEIAGFAETDLVCYRAAEPENLVSRQTNHWDPLIGWMADRYGVRLDTTTGLLPIAQSGEAVSKVNGVLQEFGAFDLAALHVLTACCGSLVIGLAVADGRMDGATAWEVSLVDETFQIEEWGEDPEATKRREGLLADIESAARFLELNRAVS